MGDTGQDEKTNSGTFRVFVTRKNVERLSKSEIECIRDPAIREIVVKHVVARGGEPKKAFPPYPRVGGENGPEIRKVRLVIRQQLGLMVPVGTGYADAAGNHHIAAYGAANGKIVFEVVSLHEAARRISARKPIVNKTKDGSSLVLSLAAGDTIEFPKGHPRAGLRVVTSVWSSGVVVTEDINDAEGNPWRPNISSIIAARARKVSVDPIGRVRLARD
jgi:CRISPR-associated endonuclease Csn1